MAVVLRINYNSAMHPPTRAAYAKHFQGACGSLSRHIINTRNGEESKYSGSTTFIFNRATNALKGEMPTYFPPTLPVYTPVEKDKTRRLPDVKISIASGSIQLLGHDLYPCCGGIDKHREACTKKEQPAFQARRSSFSGKGKGKGKGKDKGKGK